MLRKAWCLSLSILLFTISNVMASQDDQDRNGARVMNFTSDNAVPASPEILQAMQSVNEGYQSSYGADDYSEKLRQELSKVFETDVIIYLTNTGTAANSLALSALVKPFEAIYCHSEAHINTDECGAPEFFTGGAKLVTVEGANGKIDIETMHELISAATSNKPHASRPGCISITQATECGTIYSLGELAKIKSFAEEHNLPIHMDGARFANSLAHLKCTPAEATWKSGVDVMSFGATKNGALCAEAIIFFNKAYAKDFEFLHKRAGQLMSKSRFFACQFLAYLKDGLWLKNAAHANAMAKQLESIFRQKQVEILYPVQANELFVKLSANVAQHLRDQGCKFYDWGLPNSGMYRFVTSFYTAEIELKDFAACLAKAMAKS